MFVKYVTCSGVTGNKSGGDKFLIRNQQLVQAMCFQYNHSGNSYLEAVELYLKYKSLL